jgi:hypothetical protein
MTWPDPDPAIPHRFSVIVPLGARRGQTEACLRGWTRDQRFPRERYEVLAVGHPPSLSPRQREDIQGLLAPPDRLLEHDRAHDLSLAVRGAREARGELLFFTESHVLPDPDTLRRTDEAVRADPTLAALSCRSLRITDNRFGEVEADMYEADIRYGLEQHPWRKVLDQCFVMRREPYFEAGGFRDEFGHFAEWLFAAQLYRLGYRIGYAPEVVLRHYYDGSAPTLIEFARDFAEGEMRYHAQAGADPCRGMFDEIPQWFDRHRWRPDLARAACSLAIREWRGGPASLRFLAVIAGRAGLGIRPVVSRARLELWAARASLAWRLRSATSAVRQRAALIRLNEAVVRLARLRVVQRWLASPPALGGAGYPAESPWDATRAEAFRSVGFHGLEHRDGQPFRWSEPVAMLEVPLAAGTHEVAIEWLPAVRPVERLALYVDGAAQPVTLEAARGVTRVHRGAPGRAWLAWACAAWQAPGDVRFLGLPVRRVSWGARGAS